MRDISGISDLLASGERIEPVVIIAMYLGDGKDAKPIFFADRNLYSDADQTQLTTPGRILEVGGLDEEQRSDSTGMAGSVSIVLDDRDGAMKALFDGLDLHKKKVNVYQSFEGLAGEGATGGILVFSGQVSTPLVWDEGKRTFAFDVVSKLEDLEVGYSAEMSTFQLLPQELMGKPWPLVFGYVHHSPCLRLMNIPTAFTVEPFGIADRTIDTEIANLKDLLQLAISATQYYSLQAEDPSDPLGFNNEIQKDPTVKQYVQMQQDIQDRITELQQTSGWQGGFYRGSVDLIPTVYITQPYDGLFRVGNMLFDGHLDKDGGTIGTTPRMLPGSPASSPGTREGFQFINAGTQAVIAGDYPIRYVASCVPGTVTKVWAMRSFNGLRQMAEVPSDYYTIESSDLGNGMTATFVVLNQPLSTRAMVDNMKTQNWENTFGKSLPPHIVNQIDWEDEIYVSFQSSVGPNAVDIMQWVITNFSQNGIDGDSFGTAHGKVAGLPMNFTLSANPHTMDLLAEIAYQAKCIIYLREDTFHLLYLPGPATAVDSITESDVMVDSLQVSCTPTEDLVTKFTATFRPDYSPFFDEPVKMVVRYNIPKYGVHQEDHDFYCYNNFAPVQSALTFWVIRKSQTWKVLKARLLLSKLNLEVFDYVTLGFAHPYVSTDNCVGLITKCNYDSANKWIDVEVWCPVLLGEMKTSNYAFPAGATEKIEWPQYKDMAGGGGGNLSTPDLGKSNPRTEQAGQVSVDDKTSWWQDSGYQPRPYDWGWPDPGGVAPMPVPMPTSKKFPYTPKPVDDPTRDYSYKTYPDVTKVNGTFPGLVKSKEGTASGDGSVYSVDVYTQGIKNDPVPMKVTQLQIDPDDEIPSGSWTEVSVLNGTDKDGKPFQSITMQVPVWLE